MDKLNSLKKEWYKKLKDSGFVDIEHDNGQLNVPSAPSAKNKTPLQLEVHAQYYQMAVYFLNEYKFDSKLEKVIWGYHADGITNREISSLLKGLRVYKKVSPSTVRNTIKRLEAIMKVKYIPT